MLQLNNPAALNSLDIEMVSFLNDILPTFTSSPSTGTQSQQLLSSKADASPPSAIRATIFIANQEKRKVFCAGGNMKRIYLAGMGLSTQTPDIQAFQAKHHGYGFPGLETSDFFREEYQMNYKIALQLMENKMPQISIWDGIVMGGGVGLSIHGKYRVATQHTMFAFPETNIGFFPDVGASHVLPKLNGGIGNYIALTGARLYADDLMYAGLATHYVPSENVDGMLQRIVEESVKDSGEVGETNFVAGLLMSHHEELDSQEKCFLEKNREQIDEAFEGKQSVEDIMIVLEESNTEFARDTLDILRKMSPTSLKVTLESMIRGKRLNDIGECLKMEYRIGQMIIRKGSDFYEGVRAVLVDKDRNPNWSPTRLEDVTETMVASYFEELGGNELVLEGSDSIHSPKL